MVNKGSSFADFERFCPDAYAHTQQSLAPLWAAEEEQKQLFADVLQNRCS